MTTSMTNGIHNRLKTLKIVSPLHPFSCPAHMSHSSMQLHIHRDTPDGGASSRRPAVPRTPQACDAPSERVPILMSKPRRQVPYRVVPDAIWDRNAYCVRKWGIGRTYRPGNHVARCSQAGAPDHPGNTPDPASTR